VARLRVLLFLNSAPAFAWVRTKAGALIAKIVEQREKGLIVVPIKTVNCDESASPFYALQALPRSVSKGFFASDTVILNELTEELRRPCDPMVAELLLRQLNLEQLKRVATSMTFSVPQAEDSMPYTRDMLVTKCRNRDNWHFTFDNLFEAIEKASLAK